MSGADDGAAGRPRAVRTLRRQAPPPGIWASKYDVALGAEICRRMAAGESLRSICRADPSMPTEKTVWNWARAHPEFARMRAYALAIARYRRLAAVRARDRRRWDGAVERAAEMAAATAAGDRSVDGRSAAWNLGLDDYVLDGRAAETVLDRIAAGEALTAICGPGRDAGLPSVGTVYNWLRRYPAFLDDYRRARALQPEAVMDRMMGAVERRGIETLSRRELDRRLRLAERRAAWLSPKAYASP